MTKEKLAKRINEIIEEVLTEGKTLNEEELKELQDLLKKYEAEKEKAKKQEKASLSEVIDMTATIKLGEKAIEESKKLAFSKLSLKEKGEFLNKKFEEANAGLEKLTKEQKDKQAKEDFENFYEDYLKQVGGATYE